MGDLLQGLRLVSFNHFLMGPLGVQFLADLGADVIAIEPPGGAFQRRWKPADKSIEGETAVFIAANRNKRSMALDLKSEAGRDIALRLIKTADVISENFRPGVMERLGLGFERLRTICPGLIYASASGFGPDGPLSQRPGQDLLVQAMSGLAHVTGKHTLGSRAVGVSVIDHHGASLLAAGILAALVRKGRTGQGGRVEVDLLSSAIDLQTESIVAYANGEAIPDTQPDGAQAGWYYGAPYGIYPTASGELALSLGPLEPVYETLALPVNQRVSQSDSFLRRREANAAIADALLARPAAEWSSMLDARGVWNAVVENYEGLMKNPQVVHNGNLQPVRGASGGELTLVGHPVRYDGRRPSTRIPPQRLGAQTRDVLRELDYRDAEIDLFAANGVVQIA